MGLRYLGNIIRPGYNPLASNITTGVNTAQYQGVFTLQQQAQAQNTQAWTTDPIFENTTLLLQSDNAANGSQNNTFLDSSSNNFAITRNGNTTQGSFTPFSLQPGAWSAYLTSVYGSSTFTSRTLFNGNSTIELWVYPNALSGQQTFVRGGGLNFGTNGAKLRIDDGVNAGSIFESTGNLTANTWNHVAVVRTSNTFALYINGNLDSSNASIFSFYTSNATDLNTGAFNSGGTNAFAGYLSNIRVSNVARTISVPSIPYSSDANTVWLIFQSNLFVDNSSNAYALTFVGTPSIQAFSPFAPQFQWTPSVIGGSGFFDGSGDSLSVATNAALTVTGNVDACFEAWIYPTATPGATAAVLQKSGISGSVFPNYELGFSSSRLLVLFGGNSGSPGSSVFTLNGATTLPLNAWSHVVGTKRYVGGGAVNEYRVFVNGKLDGYVTAANISDGNAQAFTVGAQSGGTAFTGYISGSRVFNTSIPASYQTTSTTVGTQIFTSPTAPATAGTASILCNFTNAGIVDATMKNNLETVGNAQVSTAVVKYGSGSMAFDGTGDYALTISSVANSALGSGDWTVEFWLYTNVGSTTYTVIDWRPFSTQGAYFSFYLNSGTPTYYTSSADRIVGGSAIPATTWTHVAVSRSGTSTKMFINGTQSGSTYTDTANYLGTVNRPAIGGGGNDANTTLNGYIDDLRVTRGIARYTQNFIPPSVALPRQ